MSGDIAVRLKDQPDEVIALLQRAGPAGARATFLQLIAAIDVGDQIKPPGFASGIVAARHPLHLCHPLRRGGQRAAIERQIISEIMPDLMTARLRLDHQDLVVRGVEIIERRIVEVELIPEHQHQVRQRGGHGPVLDHQ